jgi:hypothetical protein
LTIDKTCGIIQLQNTKGGKNMANSKYVNIAIYTQEQTRREIKARAASLGMTISEYLLKLYQVDKENDLIKEKSDT